MRRDLRWPVEFMAAEGCNGMRGMFWIEFAEIEELWGSFSPELFPDEFCRAWTEVIRVATLAKSS